MTRKLDAYNQKRDFQKTSEPAGVPANPGGEPAGRPESIVLEKVHLTSPDRELFAGTGITKEAVARYYLSVAGRLLPFLEGRILSFLRCPCSAPGNCFFQRHLERTPVGIGALSVREKDGGMGDYFYIDNKSGLVSAVQMGMVEFHCWGSRIDHLETPDTLVFDLDPDTGLDLESVRQGVRDIRQLLDERALTAFLKTSGGKGYHIVVPLVPTASWTVAQDFARQLAEAMEQRWPMRYTSSASKSRRQGRIYIDWQRNSRSATSVAPYSLRARTGAPVSMPIAWTELDTIAPADIDMAEALRRIATEDPWADFHAVRQQLS